MRFDSSWGLRIFFVLRSWQDEKTSFLILHLYFSVLKLYSKGQFVKLKLFKDASSQYSRIDLFAKNEKVTESYQLRI